MNKIKIASAAIFLLSSSIGWVGCNDRNERSGSSSIERGAPNNPQGPSDPSGAQKK
jgi:hypothetical protein